MKKIFFTFVVLGTFLTLSIPDVNAWTFFSCGGRAAARGVLQQLLQKEELKHILIIQDINIHLKHIMDKRRESL